MNVAIYIRVSTEEQVKEGYSIAAQKEKLTQFVRSQDWDIIDYYVDEGVSAKDTNRPELKRMLQDITNHEINVVLVYRLDRLTRSVLDLYQLLNTFDQHGVGFKSATEVFDTTTAIGRLFLTLVAALAQWERENMGERIRFGLEQMTLEGKFHGAVAPFGYSQEKGTLTIIEEEAEVVRLIFDKYLSGMGDLNLSLWLNECGYKTKAGNPWFHSAVSYIIQNPIYIGNLRWRKSSEEEYFEVEGAVPAIIDKQTFDEAQRMRRARSHQHPRRLNSKFIFSGFIRCGRCGNAFKGKRGKYFESREYKHYYCIGKEKGVCKIPYIEEELLERTFLDAIRFIRDQGAASEVAAAAPNKERDEINHQIESLQKDSQRIRSNREKWQRAYAADAITLEELTDRTREDKARLQELNNQIEKLLKDVEAPAMSPGQIAELLGDFEGNWQAADEQEKRAILGILLKKMVINTPLDRMPTKSKAKRIVTIDEIVFN